MFHFIGSNSKQCVPRTFALGLVFKSVATLLIHLNCFKLLKGTLHLSCSHLFTKHCFMSWYGLIWKWLHADDVKSYFPVPIRHLLYLPEPHWLVVCIMLKQCKLGDQRL